MNQFSHIFFLGKGQMTVGIMFRVMDLMSLVLRCTFHSLEGNANMRATLKGEYKRRKFPFPFVNVIYFNCVLFHPTGGKDPADNRQDC